MRTVDFDDYLDKRMKDDPNFAEGLLEEESKLESAVAVMEAREKAGLTQEQIAKKAGIPQSTIARIEKGNNTSINTMTKIALALGKTLDISFG